MENLWINVTGGGSEIPAVVEGKNPVRLEARFIIARNREKMKEDSWPDGKIDPRGKESKAGKAEK